MNDLIYTCIYLAFLYNQLTLSIPKRWPNNWHMMYENYTCKYLVFLKNYFTSQYTKIYKTLKHWDYTIQARSEICTKADHFLMKLLQSQILPKNLKHISNDISWWRFNTQIYMYTQNVTWKIIIANSINMNKTWLGIYLLTILLSLSTKLPHPFSTCTLSIITLINIIKFLQNIHY